MKIIIPMAGRGSRFALATDTNPEYKKPKPLINVKGKPMIAWALESLPFVDLPWRSAKTSFVVQSKDLIFIVQDQHEKEYKITTVIKDLLGEKCKIIIIPKVTRGAVETAMMAKDFITDEELLISDSDHYFDGTNLYRAILKKEDNVAGIIPVFKPVDKDPKWSYTLFDKENNAIAVGEKDTSLAAQGAYANIGAYYFSKSNIFKHEAQEMLRKVEMYGPEGKKEFFIAPIYQRLITKGMKIKIAIIPRVLGLGTPVDLDFFLENYK